MKIIQLWLNISPKYVPGGPINNKPTLIQRLIWHRTNVKPWYEPQVLDKSTDANKHHSVSMN